LQSVVVVGIIAIFVNLLLSLNLTDFLDIP
jgi:hypothetical protein